MNDIDLEKIRLNILEEYRILDTPPEHFFDSITEAVARLTNTPIVLVSLIDESRQWFKSTFGIEAKETSRSIAFCNHAIQQDAVYIIEDALNDPRYRENPLVTEEPNIRFYAGAPLKMQEGVNIGTLCVIDNKPRKINEDEIKLLESFSSAISNHLASRKALLKLSDRYAEELFNKNMMEKYFSFVTHELKTPLGVILGNLELIKEGYCGDISPDTSESVEASLEHVNKIIRQVNTLLDIQRQRTNIGNFKFNLTNLDSVLESACSNIKGFLPQKNVTIDLNIEENIVITADADHLVHAIENLLSNAIKFSPENSTVELSATENAGQVTIKVSDKGKGIEEELKPIIFNKYIKGQSRDGVTGSGIGLAIAKDIVEAHNGNISFHPNKGGGTSFIITLPL